MDWLESGKLELSIGGHDPPLLVTREGEATVMSAWCLPLIVATTEQQFGVNASTPNRSVIVVDVWKRYYLWCFGHVRPIYERKSGGMLLLD